MIFRKLTVLAAFATASTLMAQQAVAPTDGVAVGPAAGATTVASAGFVVSASCSTSAVSIVENQAGLRSMCGAKTATARRAVRSYASSPVRRDRWSRPRTASALAEGVALSAAITAPSKAGWPDHSAGCRRSGETR